MSVVNAIPLLAAAGGDYQISRSVRLRSSATAYLSKATVGTPTNKSKWTMSMWVKRGALSSNYFSFFGKTINSAANFSLYFNTTTDQVIWNFNNTYYMTTSQVFRDPSAWYHFVFVWDSANATAGLRARIYCNGVEITSWAVDNRANITTSMDCWNTNDLTYPHTIGAGSGSPASLYYDGYMTEVNFIDGQALTPSSFGETDAVTGVWKPKKYAGTYGTNGFYLNFSDPSAATAAAIGKDSSGNGNNWTPNNISVTAGLTYDSMLDVPTMWADGGNGRGNYAVLNPLDKGGDDTVLNGNLAMYTPTSGGSAFVVRSSIAIPVAGKWYWEGSSAALNGNPANNAIFGVIAQASALTSYLGSTATGYGYFANNGNKYNNGAATAYGATYTSTDVIGIAFDADAGTLTFYKNNVSQGVAFSGLTGTTYFAAVGNGGSGAYINFGQQGFTYTPPTGFKALNTQNLPDATIKKGNQYFDATTYTGNGSTQSVVNAGGFQPDLVWTKSRTGAYSHQLYDSIRGVNNFLGTNNTNAETAGTLQLTSFNSNGFTLGSNENSNTTNGYAAVGWQWKESASAGFDIVTYTGTGANRTIAHSLGVAPKMIIAKHTNAVDNWIVYHASLGGSPDYLWLNLTSAKGTSSAVWNTAPTSSVFGVGTDNLTNVSGGTYVAYLFSEVAGFSKFGSYTGNGSADGPFVYLGFRPKFVMVKRTDSTGDWVMVDTSRDTYNYVNSALYADQSYSEGTVGAGPYIDALSNGFKNRSTFTNWNASGGTYIFAAFAENPFKNSLAR